MVPSDTGSFSFAWGEHRNVLAIMLLNWQKPNGGQIFSRIQPCSKTCHKA
ncbi:hypothetical protein JCM19236_1338 [Vibrio sp. JCM 19236]|nr:hypothetical protein JCM19236_1338 [Vibrio sp. JCM 19236]